MKTSKLILLAIIAVFTACKEEVKVEEKEHTVTWAENVFTELPIEKDSLWKNANLSNANNDFNRDYIVKSIKESILSGKMKAYKNYPDQVLSLEEINNILIQWDTVQTEDPANPGVVLNASVKEELEAFHIPFIKFNETILFDTLSYSFKKNVSYISIYKYDIDKSGNVLGVFKLFDVK